MISPKHSPLCHALHCASTYGWAVFPANRNKSPRTPNGHKAASTDPEILRAIWAQYGGPLVGIRTGEASNLAVLDIDRQHGGIGWWQSNRHRVPPTRTHRTRSGGLHLLFLNRPGLRCSTARLSPGIDVKAEGGAVIYWPSTGLPVLSDEPLAEWPGWLALPPKPALVPMYRAGGLRPAHVESALAGLVRTIASAPVGERNTRLFWSACRVGELIRKGVLSKAAGEAVLMECASRIGLAHSESTSTIRSAFTRGVG